MPFSLLTREVCVGSFVLVTVVAVVAAAITIYRQRRLLGSSKREQGEGKEKENDPTASGDDSTFRGKWPTSQSGEVESSEETRRNPSRDPLEFCEHIPGEMKKVKQRMAEKKIEEEMTEDQRATEREVKRDQMEAIFRLLKEQEDKFGISSVDDMDRQMNMYYNIG